MSFYDLDDDHEAQATQSELSFAKSKLGSFLDLVPAGLFVHQAHGIVYANSEAARILGVSADLLVGRHYLDFLSDDSARRNRICFYQCLSEKIVFKSIDSEIIDQSGQVHYIQVSMSPLFWEGLPVINILLHDVSDLKRKEKELIRLSTTDFLTGAANRRYFMERAESEMAKCREIGGRLSLLAIDIDFFKRINDSYGHPAGDQAIRAMASNTASCLAPGQLLGRLGGEEFAALAPGVSPEEACGLAETIRHAVASIRLVVDDQMINFTCSIGVSHATPFDPSIETVFRRADQALYEAKNSGRNRVVEKLGPL